MKLPDIFRMKSCAVLFTLAVTVGVADSKKG